MNIHPSILFLSILTLTLTACGPQSDELNNSLPQPSKETEQTSTSGSSFTATSTSSETASSNTSTSSFTSTSTPMNSSTTSTGSTSTSNSMATMTTAPKPRPAQIASSGLMNLGDNGVDRFSIARDKIGHFHLHWTDIKSKSISYRRYTVLDPFDAPDFEAKVEETRDQYTFYSAVDNAVMPDGQIKWAHQYSIHSLSASVSGFYVTSMDQNSKKIGRDTLGAYNPDIPNKLDSGVMVKATTTGYGAMTLWTDAAKDKLWWQDEAGHEIALNIGVGDTPSYDMVGLQNETMVMFHSDGAVYSVVLDSQGRDTPVNGESIPWRRFFGANDVSAGSFALSVAPGSDEVKALLTYEDAQGDYDVFSKTWNNKTRSWDGDGVSIPFDIRQKPLNNGRIYTTVLDMEYSEKFGHVACTEAASDGQLVCQTIGEGTLIALDTLSLPRDLIHRKNNQIKEVEIVPGDNGSLYIFWSSLAGIHWAHIV